MYLQHWELNDYPFENVANSRYFFQSNAHRVLCEDLKDGIMRRKGAIALCGDIGCGKSTIIQRILLELPEDRFDIALITYARFTPLEMLAEVAQQLGIDADPHDKGDILHKIQEHLSLNAENDCHTIVCIDDAQAIPSLDTFEELRLLLNFQLGNRFLMSLIFIGQPELRHKIAELPQLQQRIALNLNLGHFDLSDTAHYILHRLHAAGSERPVLTKQAIMAIHRHTNGVPRRINHLMDRCLLVGMRESATLIDSKLVTATMQRYPC